MKLMVFLIEDDIEEAESIVNVLNEAAREKSMSGDIEFKYLCGTIEADYEGKHKLFYAENIIDELEAQIIETKKQQEDVEVGILLDVLLTEEEAGSVFQHYYPKAGLAKKIYFKYCERIPVYIITSIAGFATRCDIIMGTDLSERYIDKKALIQYHLQGDIDRLFEFYRGN